MKVRLATISHSALTEAHLEMVFCSGQIIAHPAPDKAPLAANLEAILAPLAADLDTIFPRLANLLVMVKQAVRFVDLTRTG